MSERMIIRAMPLYQLRRRCRDDVLSHFLKAPPMPSDVDALFQAVQFELIADADPGFMPRFLAPFARRDLLPDQVRTERNGPFIEAIVAVNEMPAEMVHLVENNLRQIVGIRRLTVVLRDVTYQAEGMALNRQPQYLKIAPRLALRLPSGDV